MCWKRWPAVHDMAPHSVHHVRSTTTLSIGARAERGFLLAIGYPTPLPPRTSQWVPCERDSQRYATEIVARATPCEVPRAFDRGMLHVKAATPMPIPFPDMSRFNQVGEEVRR
ncbi:hypothetical protein H310_09316 [Aphanomyces invadans]|uniref:Uncharacterized protein n=1 Tax=Aphanomyces invadans TaxID=157072 RepID=A0A024TV22_9STRA|nr:hypothetical protein H310_09316 [Aphanomyces invadans]ETV98015.1 hypothetical protein H310_09316 [Aphanomyces invadans]|eukprot:XP_008873576.1 hypothetical protein H310_09316 [Aphanomyces invadans]